MKTSLGKFAVGVLFVSIVALVLSLPVLAAQQAAAPPEAPGPSQAQADSVRTAEGQLSKVDSTAKTITIKGTDNKEMTFSYSDQTQVMGADDGVQGLAGKTGSSLKVSYRVDKGTNNATKIELQSKK